MLGKRCTLKVHFRWKALLKAGGCAGVRRGMRASGIIVGCDRVSELHHVIVLRLINALVIKEVGEILSQKVHPLLQENITTVTNSQNKQIQRYKLQSLFEEAEGLS